MCIAGACARDADRSPAAVLVEHDALGATAHGPTCRWSRRSPTTWGLTPPLRGRLTGPPADPKIPGVYASRRKHGRETKSLELQRTFDNHACVWHMPWYPLRTPDRHDYELPASATEPNRGRRRWAQPIQTGQKRAVRPLSRQPLRDSVGAAACR